MGILTAALALLLATPAMANPPQRPFPDHCLVHVPGAEGGALPEALPGDNADRAWNISYQEGFRTIAAGDYPTAEREMCRALFAARQFGPRDWRFAETLDELDLYESLERRIDRIAARAFAFTPSAWGGCSSSCRETGAWRSCNRRRGVCSRRATCRWTRTWPGGWSGSSRGICSRRTWLRWRP